MQFCLRREGAPERWRAQALRPLRLILVALVVAGVGILPGHAQQSDRAKHIGRRLMCMCGICNQILTECNHVGCGMSSAMLEKLDQQVSTGGSDDLIVQAFVQEFGQKVLAEPPAQGFNWLAWVMPGLLTLAGFVFVRAVLLRWRHAPQPRPAGVAPPPEILDRVRRETEVDD